MRIRSLAVAIAAAMLVTAGARAAELYPPMQAAPAYDPSAFSFDGMYLGALLGANFGATTDGTIAAVAGVNYSGADPIIPGAEVQAGLSDHSGKAAYDLLALGHLGVLMTDSILAYGALGAGLDTTGSTRAVWAAGGGVDFGIAQSLSARGEVLYTDGFSGGDASTRVTAGLMWHLQ